VHKLLVLYITPPDDLEYLNGLYLYIPRPRYFGYTKDILSKECTQDLVVRIKGLD
jgi:hypothetical protein